MIYGTDAGRYLFVVTLLDESSLNSIQYDRAAAINIGI